MMSGQLTCLARHGLVWWAASHHEDKRDQITWACKDCYPVDSYLGCHRGWHLFARRDGQGFFHCGFADRYILFAAKSLPGS